MVFDWLLLFHELENYLLLLIEKKIITKAFVDYIVAVEDDRVVHYYEFNVQYPEEDKWVKITSSTNMIVFYDDVKKWIKNNINI